MSADVARIASEVQAAMPLPDGLDGLDVQARRQVEVLARWHRTTPEEFYRDALAQRRTASVSEELAATAVAEILSTR